MGYFYNPNIHPQEEYERRLKSAYEVSSRLNFPLEVGPYALKEWFEETDSLKDEPEGGVEDAKSASDSGFERPIAILRMFRQMSSPPP